MSHSRASPRFPSPATDVRFFEEEERARPQFKGTVKRPNPITGMEEWHYPIYRRLRKFVASYSSILFMACIVILSAVSIITYRVVATNIWLDSTKSSNAVFFTFTPSLLNAVRGGFFWKGSGLPIR